MDSGQASQAAFKLPDHVPPHLVVDFNYRNDPRLLPDLHRGVLTFLGGPDLVYTPHNGGHWVATKPHVVRDLLRSPDKFSNVTVNIPRVDVEKKYPIELDPPEHTKWRKVLQPLLAKEVATRLEQATREAVDDAISRVISVGECEFVSAVGGPVPASVFMDMMGLPSEDFDRFSVWVWDILHSQDTIAKGQVYKSIVEYLEKLIIQRRVVPRSDLITAMATATIDGELAPIAAARSMCLMLFLGGLDTTTNAMGFSINHLARNPDHRKQLVDDPSLIENAVEELLRRYAFSTGVRNVTKDMQFHGIELRADDQVLLYMAPIGLDDTAIDNPMRVDFKRPQPPHLAFGAGIHNCPGAHLARLELRVFLERWLARIPDFSVKAGAPFVLRAGQVLGIDHLELEWPRHGVAADANGKGGS